MTETWMTSFKISFLCLRVVMCSCFQNRCYLCYMVTGYSEVILAFIFTLQHSDKLIQCFVCTLQRSLATDLQNLSMELRKKQSTYLKRLRLQKEVWRTFLYHHSLNKCLSGIRMMIFWQYFGNFGFSLHESLVIHSCLCWPLALLFLP